MILGTDVDSCVVMVSAHHVRALHRVFEGSTGAGWSARGRTGCAHLLRFTGSCVGVVHRAVNAYNLVVSDTPADVVQNIGVSDCHIATKNAL